MSRKDERKADLERIRTNSDEWRLMSRWPTTITALFVLSIGIEELATGHIRSWRSLGVLLMGIYMATSAIRGWRVYYRRKQHKL